MFLGKISNRCLRVLFVQAAWVVLVKLQMWKHWRIWPLPDKKE